MSEVKLNPGKVNILECGTFAPWEYKDDPGFIDHLFRTAGTTIGVKLLKTASIHKVRKVPDDIPDNPKEDDLWASRMQGKFGVLHTWTVGVVCPDDTQAFAKQQAEERVEALHEAAGIVHRLSLNYDPSVSPCGAVLRNALAEAARVIVEAAKREKPHEIPER